MFERLLIAALFWLLPSFAMAQQVYCPTRSPGDNSNACASTAYVNNLFPSVPLTVPQGGTGVTSFTAGQPILGNGTSALSQGTTSGNTTAFTTKDATITTGHCVQWDSSGGLVDSGAVCGSGGSGSGTVTMGAAGNIAYYPSAATSVSGLVNGPQGSLLGSGGVGNAPSYVQNGVNVTSYGAKCDGSTDDTTAINNAISAVQGSTVNPGLLVFPPNKVCIVTGTLTATQPILINCQGAEIKFGAGVSTTTPMIKFAPTGAQAYRDWRISHCFLNMNSEGNNTIQLDTTATTTTELAEVEIDHVTDQASGNTIGYSILVNNSSSNTNGGTFNSNFHDNVFFNGIYLNFAGDSIRIQDNILSGTKFGVYASLISGAGGLLIKGNNITAAAPIDVDGSAGTTTIRDNEIEQEVANINPNGGLIDLNASVAGVNQILIQGNSVHDIESNCCAVPLYITASVAQAVVMANSFQTHLTSTACIGQFGTAYIGPGNQFVTCTTGLTGSGTTNSVTTHNGFP